MYGHPRDDDVLGGEPRIEGTWVGVHHVSARVIDGGQSPAYVADQLDVSLSAVYEALSYYYAHIKEMRRNVMPTTVRAHQETLAEQVV